MIKTVFSPFNLLFSVVICAAYCLVWLWSVRAGTAVGSIAFGLLSAKLFPIFERKEVSVWDKQIEKERERNRD